MRKYLRLGTALLILVCVGSASATTWNLANDFALTGTTDWSYGYYVGPTANWAVYPTTDVHQTPEAPSNTFPQWTGTSGADWLGMVGKNQGPNPIDCYGWWEVNQVIIQAGTINGQTASATARWTAPRDMQIQIDAIFTGQDDAAGTSTNAWVLLNSSTSFLYAPVNGFAGRAVNGYSDGFGSSPRQEFHGVISVLAGDWIDFTVDWSNGSYSNDATGLSAVITEVPEPTTLVLLSLGLLLRRRRR